MSAPAEDFTIRVLVDYAVILNINSIETFCIIQDDGFPNQTVTCLSADLKQQLMTIIIRSFRKESVAVVTYHLPEVTVLLIDGNIVQEALKAFCLQTAFFSKYADKLSIYTKTILAFKMAEIAHSLKNKAVPRLVPDNQILTINPIPEIIQSKTLPVLRHTQRGANIIFHPESNPLLSINTFTILQTDYKTIVDHIELNRGDTFIDRTWHKTSDCQVFLLDWEVELIHLYVGKAGFIHLSFDKFINLDL